MWPFDNIIVQPYYFLFFNGAEGRTLFTSTDITGQLCMRVQFNNFLPHHSIAPPETRADENKTSRLLIGINHQIWI